MNDGFVSQGPVHSTPRSLRHSIATALICPNSLLSAGISSTLSGTCFTVLPGQAQSRFHGCAPSDPEPDLYLVWVGSTPDGHAETVKMLKIQHPRARVVILADSMETTALVHALKAGLDGLCLSTMPRESLITTLELVMLGEIFVPADLVFAMTEVAMRDGQPRAGFPAPLVPAADSAAVATLNTLSGREVQILHCVAQGASNKLIARELGLAEATVKVHIKSILRKVNAGNRTQAALWASEHMTSRSVVHSQGRFAMRRHEEGMREAGGERSVEKRLVQLHAASA